MVRCKFVCQSVKKTLTYEKKIQYSYEMSPVCNNSPENKTFWEATPSGSFRVDCVLSDAFEIGKEYYFDISEAN